MTDSERHRLSLIIATLGPSTDNEKELITMLMAGIAKAMDRRSRHCQSATDDRHDIAKERIDTFREQSKKTYQLLSILIQMAQTLMNMYLYK